MSINIQNLTIIAFILSTLLFQQSAKALQLTDFSHRAVQVRLISKKANILFFDVFSSQSNNPPFISTTPNPEYFNSLGLCFANAGTRCLVSFRQRDRWMEAFGKSVGRRSIPKSWIPSIENKKVENRSSGSIKNGKLIIENIQRIDELQYKSRWEVALIPGLSDKELRLKLPETDRSQRESIDSQSGEKRELARSVFQVMGGPKIVDNLLGNTTHSGTGFFLDNKGLMMTNYHVISSYPKCLQDLQCELLLRMVGTDGLSFRLKAQASVYAESQGFDFVLLKLYIKSNLRIKAIEIETKQLGPNVFSLGFPGDIVESGGPSSHFQLTYSKGYLVGFRGRTFSTSVYIYGGASGSPLLNESNNRLIGIVSDTYGNPEKGIGSPALVRPMGLINEKFDIEAYVDGSKIKLIREQISRLGVANSATSAQRALQAIAQEFSLYGVNQINKIMIQNENPKIRKLIFDHLKKQNLVRGQLGGD